MVNAVAKYQKYAEYKDSGVEWLGEIPSHWVTSRLKYYTNQIVDGAHFTPTYSDSGVPFLRVTDIHNDAIDFDNIKYIPEKEHQELIQRCKPEKGDLLLSKNGTIGVPKRITWDWEFSIFVSLCLIKFKKELKVEFAEYFFKSYEIREQIFGLIKKSTVINLHLDKIENFWFAFPRIDEQIQIINFLDHETAKIDSLIEKQQKLIELLKEKRQAVISHAVTKGLNSNVPMKDSGVEWLGQVPEHWRVTKLSYVANGFNGDRGSNYPSGEDFVDEGIPFISTSDLINGKVLVNNVSRITEDRYSLLGGLKIYFGDIIYCLRGSVGKNGICEFNEGTIASSLMGIRCTSVNPYYLLLLLNSSIESQQRANYTTGSVSANLSAENVMSYKFAFPCEKEQLEISEKLKKVFEDFDQLIAKAESAIQLMQERRTALISSAVTGKIDVRNWQNPNHNNNEANTEFGA